MFYITFYDQKKSNRMGMLFYEYNFSFIQHFVIRHSQRMKLTAECNSLNPGPTQDIVDATNKSERFNKTATNFRWSESIMVR